MVTGKGLGYSFWAEATCCHWPHGRVNTVKKPTAMCSPGKPRAARIVLPPLHNFFTVTVVAVQLEKATYAWLQQNLEDMHAEYGNLKMVTCPEAAGTTTRPIVTRSSPTQRFFR